MNPLEIDDFCVVTESSDRTSHFTRVAISSFIETNPWFNGTIVILNTRHDLLSQKNIESLKSIYHKIIPLTVDCAVMEEITLNIKRKTKAYNTFLLKLLFIFSFKIKSKGTLYFSQMSVFFNSVDFLLSSNKFSGVVDSNLIEADTYSTGDITSSVFYIPTCIQEKAKLEDLIQISKLSDICGSPSVFSKILNNYLNSSSVSIKIHSNAVITKSSFFPDKKISAFKAIQDNVSAVIINTHEDTRRLFNKIHTVWNQKNSQISINLSKPINNNVNVKKIMREKLENRQKQMKEKEPSSALQKVAASDFILNSGSTLADKTIALCTICNDNFLIGAKVLIYSFLKNNPWFNHKIIVFYNSTYSPLSQDSMKSLMKIYPVEFREVNTGSYSKLISHFSASGRNPKRFIPSLFTFEAFELAKEFEKVLYLDSDMVVLKDISELFNLPGEVIVTPDAGKYSLNSNYSTFNGGFLLIDETAAYGNYRNKLIDRGEHLNMMLHADQTIMNSLLKDVVKVLDSRYNCLKRCFPDNLFSKIDGNIKIIHYVGEKPWMLVKKPFEKNYKKIEKFWKDYEVLLKKENL